MHRHSVRAVEQLGDAEVQQPHLPVGGDQDVGWLEVAVHHQVGVRVADRAAHLQDQLHPCLDRQLQALAVVGDRFAFDIGQRKKWLAVGVHAGIQQLGKVGMLEPGEDVALAAEAQAQVGIGVAGAQQLQRDRAPVQAVGALGQPHLAHAALAQEADQPVRADQGFVTRLGRWRRPQRLGEEVVAVALLRKQPLQFVGKRGIGGMQVLQAAPARRPVHFQQLVQQGREEFPAGLVHLPFPRTCVAAVPQRRAVLP